MLYFFFYWKACEFLVAVINAGFKQPHLRNVKSLIGLKAAGSLPLVYTVHPYKPVIIPVVSVVFIDKWMHRVNSYEPL